MKILFFLIIFLIPVGLAHAEVGKNFDTIQIGNGLTKWTSHPDRIFNGVDWKNYLFTNDIDFIKYESGGISFKLNKNDCTFNIYDPGVIGEKIPDIDSFSHTIQLDGKDVIESCTISTIIQTPESLQITINNGNFSTIYDLSYTGSVEWTFDLDNQEGKQTRFTIQDTCKGCIPDKTQGDLIQFGDFILNTKNKEHNTLVNSTSDKGDYIMTYEKILNNKEVFSIDPSFTSAGTSMSARDSAIANPACGTGVGLDILTPNLGWVKPDSLDGALACSAGIFEVDVTSIPDASGITNSTFSATVTSVSNPTASNFTKISSATQPSTRASNPANALALYNEAKSGTALVTGTTQFQTPALNEEINLGSNADFLIRNDIQSGKNWVAIGFIPTSNTRDGLDHQIVLTTASARLSFIYGTYSDAITDLRAIDIRATAVDLAWTAPATFGGTTTGYAINNTLPWGNPQSILTLNTSSALTTSTISPLTGNTNYSFRVSAATTVINGSGNILNITTDVDPNFIIGQLVLNNSKVIGTPLPILFETVKLNSSAVQLYVKYSNTYALGCDFHYKFANTNQTYNNLASTVLDASRNQTSFIFNNFTNEVIDAKCFDINSPLNRTARTEITQTGFPMLDLIANFRNGTYGTMGQFGAFDMITLLVVMFSMVGMNRVNEAVGVIFCVAVIGGLSVVGVFGIITWPTALSGIVVLIIGLAIVTTRKD